MTYSDTNAGIGGFVRMISGVLASVSLLAIAILFFQNCSGDGRNSSDSDSTLSPPANEVILNLPQAQLAAAEWRSCALSKKGRVYCWGALWYNQYGAVASISLRPRYILSGVKQINLGYMTNCAIMHDDTVKCWKQDGNTPVQIDGLSNVAKISGYYTYSCALTLDDKVKCWANDLNSAAVEISGLGTGILGIAGDYYRSCAITSDKRVKCWQSPTDPPHEVWNLSNVEEISMADGICARLTDGTVQCKEGVNITTIPGVANVTKIFAGETHYCAISQDQSLWCWGNNSYGECGPGPTTVTTANRIGSFLNIVGGGAGFDHTCALTNNNQVYCWGAGNNAQLGNGGVSNSATPVYTSLILE